MSAQSIRSLHDSLKDLIQQLNCKATDIHCEMRNEELQSTKKRKSEVSLWLERVTCIEGEAQSIETEVEKVGCLGSTRLIKKLQGMTERAENLIKQSEFPRGLLLNDSDPHGLPLVTEKLEGSTPMKVQDRVWSCFESGNKTRVGVHGMGGVGKTSVSMHINNKILEQKGLFHHVFYVTVSRETSVSKLQQDIARALNFDLNYGDEPKRAAELHRALQKREKSLLILDDVWEDLPMGKVGVSGCNLLITTRKRDVCLKMECHPIELRPLSKVEAWNLFKEKLGHYFEELSDEAKRIAGLVANECGGLPLGIITVAGSMRGESSEHVWRDALRTLQSPCSTSCLDDMDNKVFSILRFSYDRLKDEKHKKCFLFCALYPEDNWIDRDELISQLIGLGLIDGEGSRQEKIDRGYTLLNGLVNASLLDTGLSLFGVKCLKMHDLVRDMAIKIIGVRGVVKAGIRLTEVPQELVHNKDVEWVSLMHNDIQSIVDMRGPNCPDASVFLLHWNDCLQSMPDPFFVHMVGLKVLNLCGTKIKALPLSVSDLVNLKSILLSGCSKLTFIPSLEKLTKLTEMDLCGCQEMFKFPEGMSELVSLEHLDVRETGVRGLHEGVFCKLGKLEVILADSGLIVPPMELASLTSLKTLMGVQLLDPESLKQCVDLCTVYQVTVGSDMENSIFDYEEREDCDRRIVVVGREFVLGSTESLFLALQSTQVLEIDGCNFSCRSLLDAIPSLCDASELEYCELYDCAGMEYVFPEGWSQPLALQCIRYLRFDYCVDFYDLRREEVVQTCISLSGLTKLEITECHQIKRLWVLNIELPNLKEIIISECDQLESIFATREGATILLPKLHSLRLEHLEELRSIWWGDCVSLPLLVDLKVVDCPKVQKLGLTGHGTPSLTNICLSRCEELEEIFGEEGRDNVPIHLPNLELVSFNGLPELRRIYNDTLVCNSLELLEIDKPSLGGGLSTGDNLENWPISITRQSLEKYDKRCILRVWNKPKDWWDSLNWYDPATKALLQQFRCLQYKFPRI